MKTALVILAAGIGARYGGGIKQLEPVGPMGEIIMDYSIHDAIAAGFDKIVFIKSFFICNKQILNLEGSHLSYHKYVIACSLSYQNQF